MQLVRGTAVTRYIMQLVVARHAPRGDMSLKYDMDEASEPTDSRIIDVEEQSLVGRHHDRRSGLLTAQAREVPLHQQTSKKLTLKKNEVMSLTRRQLDTLYKVMKKNTCFCFTITLAE